MAFTVKASSPSSPATTRLTGALHGGAARVAARKLPAASLTLDRAPAPAGAERGMSSSVSRTMSRLREKGKAAFIPYITAGDPDMGTTAEALRVLDACGADVIELGVPFSDPYTDGPVIQASAARALAAGATLDGVMSMLKEVTPELSCPVVLFSYFGPIVRRGPANFTAAAKEAGVQGLIVPDLPYVETCTFRSEATKNNLELVLLTTPTTPPDRMKAITAASGGFVYLVSVNGVTGSRQDVNPRVEHLLQEIKQVTDKAVCVGYGISTPDHVRQIAEWGADGVIIGSAMVRQLGEAASPKQGLKRLEKLQLELNVHSVARAYVAMAFTTMKASPMSASSSSAPVLRRCVAPPARVAAAWRLAAAAASVALEASPVPAAAAVERRMSVSQTMSKLKEKGKTAFIPYITAGDPDMGTTAEALRLLDACGADVIELGVPFSDPYADGPVIQASASRALAAGATPEAVLSMLKEVTPELSCPVVLLSYLGPILRRGAANFTAAAKEAGVQGLIVPDLPYVDTCTFRSEAIKSNLELVLLTTPATPGERMKIITEASGGFVYLVSVNGVTGPRPKVNTRVEHLLQDIKLVTDKAVCVGFGISTPDHVRQIAGWGADGVIIGSAMVRQLGEAASPKQGLKRLEEYARRMKDALP
uniref:Uncharacterized protein n=1 Tax=Oryza glumipatula TaxID=40148 RepID=A0A0D9ZEF2_9ORYZ